MKSINRKILLVILFLFLAGAGQAKTYQAINEIPGDVPETDEEAGIWQLGIAHQEEVRKTGDVIDDPELEKYLEGIVSRLLGDILDVVDMEVDVLVFKDPTVNAWVYPNGTVAVQTGLLSAMQNEAQLASILGHEVSHFLNRHAFIQIKSKQKNSVIGKGLGLLATAAVAAKTGALNTDLMKTGQLWTELVTSGYSRSLESAADEQGLQLLMEAGYSPEQALPAFEQLRIKDDDQINVAKMWSSHPDIDSRKKNLAKQIKRADAQAGERGLSKEDYLQAVNSAVLTNARLLMERRQFDAAIASLSDFNQTVTDSAVGHYLLGEAYRQQEPEGQYDQRIKAYQNSVTLDANDAQPLRELAMTYRQQGQVSLARDAFQAYLNLAPNAADAPIMAWYRDNLQTDASANTD